MQAYTIEEKGNARVLNVEGKSYQTIYSAKVIELLISRKGLNRTLDYLRHKEKRSYFLTPIFSYLKAQGKVNLKVLEAGCSAGQLTELLDEQDFISEICCFDVDKALIEVSNLKAKELRLNKVKNIDCLTTAQTESLPYEDNYFELILVVGVVEHLPFEARYRYVDEYYRKLKIGGLICFLNTPNRKYFFDWHTTGLPFINWLSPQNAFIYAKLFGKLKRVSFPEFVRPGTGWRGATYYECLPQSRTIVIDDISESAGYGYSFFRKCRHSLKFRIFIKPFFKIIYLFSRLLNFPVSFFLPELNVVFKKVLEYEK